MSGQNLLCLFSRLQRRHYQPSKPAFLLHAPVPAPHHLPPAQRPQLGDNPRALIRCHQEAALSPPHTTSSALIPLMPILLEGKSRKTNVTCASPGPAATTCNSSFCQINKRNWQKGACYSSCASHLMTGAIDPKCKYKCYKISKSQLSLKEVCNQTIIFFPFTLISLKTEINLSAESSEGA